MRILVSTASRHGSTTGIGDVLAAELRGQGHDVVTASISPDGDPTGGADVGDVEAAIIGGPVYLGAWMDNAATAQAAMLGSDLRTYAFAVGMHDFTPDPTSPEWVAARSAETAHQRVLFGGAITRVKLSPAEKAMLAAEDEEFTDWNDVKAWAVAVAHDLETADAS